MNNFDSRIASTEIVFVNFYADWCPFSNLLAPIFEETANKIEKEFGQAGRVVLGRVDCVKQGSIASRYKVNKYPTLKLFRNGVTVKKEYRGQRSPQALMKYIRNELKNPIQQLHELNEVLKIDVSNRVFIGYMRSNMSKDFDTYQRVAGILKDECSFYVRFGNVSSQSHPSEHDIIEFRPDYAHSIDQNDKFTGNIDNFGELFSWTKTKCENVVRQITFENAEELAEEGLPLLILFHHPSNTDSSSRFKKLVQRELAKERQSINFLTADGLKFSYPLHRVGKSRDDLPIIAIDSFQHMYLFPDAKQMDIPGKLKQFITDFHSGKLHQEYHNGPDPANRTTRKAKGGGVVNQKLPKKHLESAFKKLAPSSSRYSFVRDEL
ncbi:unnamed protein product [Allacma fusca]|uniref:Thioredoxin domain-containing protein n=1 Tax=Allacma fusca TaxID=39272 RepID=A0A8J2LR16_9HEXA|nr:unnamed protein product [Allacma fusca]